MVKTVQFRPRSNTLYTRTERKDRRLFTSLYGRGWGVDCDEVVPGVYIGDKASILNTSFLNRQEITHALNAAEGRDEGVSIRRILVRYKISPDI